MEEKDEKLGLIADLLYDLCQSKFPFSTLWSGIVQLKGKIIAALVIFNRHHCIDFTLRAGSWTKGAKPAGLLAQSEKNIVPRTLNLR